MSDLDLDTYLAMEPEPETPRCIVCDSYDAPVYAKDRCETCYRYRRRHGHDRPISLVIAHGRRGRRPDRGMRRAG